MAVNQRGCRRISVMIGGCPELVGVGEGERTIGRREVEIRLGFFFGLSRVTQVIYVERSM